MSWRRCHLPKPAITSQVNWFALQLRLRQTTGEAQSAESRRDFIHKLKVALKELRETLVWLKIIERKPLCEPNKMREIIPECNELICIFVASVKTAESKNLRTSKIKNR